MATVSMLRWALRWVRLVLGGAAFGVAMAGALGGLVGLDDRALVDAVGALAGSAASAVLIKLAHIV